MHILWRGAHNNTSSISILCGSVVLCATSKLFYRFKKRLILFRHARINLCTAVATRMSQFSGENSVVSPQSPFVATEYGKVQGGDQTGNCTCQAGWWVHLSECQVAVDAGTAAVILCVRVTVYALRCAAVELLLASSS